MWSGIPPSAMTYVVGAGAAEPSTSPVNVRVTRIAFAERSAATAMSAWPEWFRSSAHEPSQVPGQPLRTASISASAEPRPVRHARNRHGRPVAYGLRGRIGR